MKKLILLALFVFIPFANAGPITTTGGNDYAVVSSNNILDKPGTYNIGANVMLSQQSDLKFTYLGHEAAYSNDFNVGNYTLNNKTNSVGDFFIVEDVNAGLLQFDFFSYGVNAGIANGYNNPYTSWQSFAIQLDLTFNGNYYDAILAFDDSGAGPDDNHDDHIIGIRSVPTPSALAFLGLALIGFSLHRRNKRN